MGRIFDALQRSNGDKDIFFPEPSNSTTTEVERIETVAPAVKLDAAHPLVVKPDHNQRLVTLDGQRSLGSENIRILAARLTHLQEQKLIKRLLVTSSVKDEGKTVLAVNLAVAFAKMKQRVLLIDGDWHQAGAGQLMGVPGAPGLMDWYRAESPIETFVRRVEGLPLWFLPAGTPLEQSVEMLQSQKVQVLLEELSASYDWIVIDSPPSAPLADSACWAQLVQGILLVARNGATPKRLLKKVLASLDKSKLLGIVLNDCPDPDLQYYKHYYNAPTVSEEWQDQS
jgi:protein-tyrosine kinase